MARIFIVQVLEDGWADYARRASYCEAVSVKDGLEDNGYLSRVIEAR